MTERVGMKPLLIGRVHGSLLRVWCPFCLVRHDHGWEPNESDYDERRMVKFEHRAAHCAKGSPLHDGGYWIAEEGYEREAARVLIRRE